MMRRKLIHLDPSFQLAIIYYPDGSGVLAIIEPEDQPDNETYVIWQTFVPGNVSGYRNRETMAHRLCKPDLDAFSQQWRAMVNKRLEHVEKGQN